METIKKKNTGKKILSIASVLIFIGVLTFVGFYFIWPMLKSFENPNEFKAYIDSYGIYGMLIFLGIQFLQVFIALIPGEFVEIGAGYAFGAIQGALLCLLGVAIASAIVFLLTKTLGVRMVHLFIDEKKLENNKLLNNPKRLNSLVFILYLIPGTPKDLFTYIVGLTKMKLRTFLLITTIARIPSVISSTLGGKYLMEKDWKSAAIVFGVTAAFSVAGYLFYNLVLNRKKKA
ncbi:MAG: VTT domain-containing protein [Oscillospiraceae bacterium]|jgi:uncharacterized membrane protein YdjX (TVP38/TMEM64 family)|nr:VTT domain-containing protein [Oscillospiraceae bacterium]